ncbi:sensor domain-containing protein [Mycobacterium sp. CPCC 205710]|uniref:histidine kinase n=1 Tax=Mycobacterium deserti TaxID=2978347 RepID=A0ABT2M9B7_9MYCO|nr:sensor domain-containing protein [Mycobacterium deserti]MCT7658843.1 sensor domain-containing protein [Mycobacterium deserti]
MTTSPLSAPHPPTSVLAQTDWATPLRPPAWRTYLHFVLISVLAVVGVAYIFAAGLASGLLIATLVGIPLLALVVMSGRAWNRLYRALATLTGADIDAPPAFARPAGRLHTVTAALTDTVGWRSLGFLALHSVLMTPIGYFVIVGICASTALVVSPVVWLAMGEPFITLGEPVDSLGLYLLASVTGVVALYLLGWVMIGLSRAHVWMARGMLGPTEGERRVVQLERARAGVVDDSAATLQRVERDLHDGTQARLITVAMALARADEHLASADVTGARALVGDALANTKDTLTELRDLVRGIRPPALDLGLGPAIQTLAARNPLPVEVTVDLQLRPSIGVETMAYFCVAELLTNVSKHSGADHATVRIASDADELRIIVQDNGSGGIQLDKGSGLTGLRDRLAMLDGRLEIDSPDGGPTIVTVVVPPGVGQ